MGKRESRPVPESIPAVHFPHYPAAEAAFPFPIQSRLPKTPFTAWKNR